MFYLKLNNIYRTIFLYGLSINSDAVFSSQELNSLTSVVTVFVGTKYAIRFSTPKSYKSLNLQTVTSCKALKKQPFPLRLNTMFIRFPMLQKGIFFESRKIIYRKYPK